MGYTSELCNRALAATQHKSVEAALEWYALNLPKIKSSRLLTLDESQQEEKRPKPNPTPVVRYSFFLELSLKIVGQKIQIYLLILYQMPS